MSFYSILFRSAMHQSLQLDEPEFFADLNLNQVINSITADKSEYNLKPYFYTCLTDIDSIHYRHEVMRDIESLPLSNAIKIFANCMKEMRQCLSDAEKSYYKNQRNRLFINAVELYCEAINSFADRLLSFTLKSQGLLNFRDYMEKYRRSEAFVSLFAEAETVIASLSTVKYGILIDGLSVTVCSDEFDVDYSSEVEKTFEKFKSEAVKDYRIKFTNKVQLNSVEAKILEKVTKLYPDIFKSLDDYCANFVNYLDETIARFDREIQFYISYQEYIAKLEKRGLQFCYPVITTIKKDIYNYDCFDLALANILVREKKPLIVNDFYLKDKERIIVVTGPNQGGKTTFARTFGQLHYLASIGCLVPGREAKLYLFDNLFTHFEKEESIETQRGKLEDDLVRIHKMLAQATPNTIIIMNEIFTSTTIKDALFLSKEVMMKLIKIDLLCVWVTFIDELASFNEKTVSMVSEVLPEDISMRTFKILRKPANGAAYALSIVEKYQLSFDSIQKRGKL